MLTLDLPLETYRWHFAPVLSLRLAMKFGDDFPFVGFFGCNQLAADVRSWREAAVHT
jgi:hypothetical protein